MRKQEEQGIYSQDPIPHFYLYELTRKGKSQTGICACASVEEYWKGIVVKHENTREDKEQMCIRDRYYVGGLSPGGNERDGRPDRSGCCAGKSLRRDGKKKEERKTGYEK